METAVETVSKTLGIKEEDLIENGVRTYLENEKRRLNSEIMDVLSKYSVNSLEELDEKISGGELSETETFDDFARLDNLMDRRDKIGGLLRQI